jgi:hypothetical protein
VTIKWRALLYLGLEQIHRGHQNFYESDARAARRFIQLAILVLAADTLARRIALWFLRSFLFLGRLSHPIALHSNHADSSLR